jgi:hypothetical protein
MLARQRWRAPEFHLMDVKLTAAGNNHSIDLVITRS